MKKMLNKLRPKKVLICTNCKSKFRFPVLPGKRLKVTCPNCGATYQVSFVNPLVELLKGRLKWSTLSKNEKRNLIIFFITIALCMAVIYNSFKPPKQMEQKMNNELVYVF